MIGVSYERTVTVHGKAMTIYVTRTAKTVWTAAGTYMGEIFSTKGSSDSSAAKAWAEAARYKGG